MHVLTNRVHITSNNDPHSCLGAAGAETFGEPLALSRRTWVPAFAGMTVVVMLSLSTLERHPREGGAYARQT